MNRTTTLTKYSISQIFLNSANPTCRGIISEKLYEYNKSDIQMIIQSVCSYISYTLSTYNVFGCGVSFEYMLQALCILH